MQWIDLIDHSHWSKIHLRFISDLSVNSAIFTGHLQEDRNVVPCCSEATCSYFAPLQWLPVALTFYVENNKYFLTSSLLQAYSVSYIFWQYKWCWVNIVLFYAQAWRLIGVCGWRINSVKLCFYIIFLFYSF